MKNLVQSNLTLTFLLFCLLGLCIPGLDRIPNWLLIVSLSTVILLACFSIKLQEFKIISWQRLSFFYFIRFVCLPIALYYSVVNWNPSLGIALFLLALLPPATSSPAMTSIFDGDVSLSFVTLIIGSLLAPFLIAGMVHLIIGNSIPIQTFYLFNTLVLSIIVPIIFFIGLRRHQHINRWITLNGSFLAVILIGMTFTIATAKQKNIFLNSPRSIILPFIISLLCYLIFYALGWVLTNHADTKSKIAYTLSSGANNISIGVSIALIYFPPQVSLFLIVSIFPWLLVLTPFRTWLRLYT